jgi:hypothetical protein
MGAPIVVPFNFQPVAVSVRTASYTIPAGRYARVTVNVIGSGTFTIGGVTALSGSQNNVITSNNGLFRSPGTPNFSGGTAPGGLAQVTSAGSQTTGAPLAVFSNEADQKPLVIDYWLPAGTVINGTGTWRAVVQEFNNIS